MSYTQVRTTTTTTTTTTTRRFPFQTLAVAMNGERDGSGAGSARRRRERRQRSWLRHEQLSVKMALSAALPHSRGVGPELHEAPRGPKTDRAVEEEVREV